MCIQACGSQRLWGAGAGRGVLCTPSQLALELLGDFPGSTSHLTLGVLVLQIQEHHQAFDTTPGVTSDHQVCTPFSHCSISIDFL